MQRARASVVVETIGGVGLLLRLHYDGAWSQRMHRATSHVNHLALINIDPVEQLFRALVMDGLLELSQSNAGFQALSGGVVGVHLDRELFLGKQKLQKQWKAPSVGRGGAHEFGAEFFAQDSERSFRQRTICNQAVVAGEPGFADSFVEFVIWIDRRKVECAPRARVEG